MLHELRFLLSVTFSRHSCFSVVVRGLKAHVPNELSPGSLAILNQQISTALIFIFRPSLELPQLKT